MWNEYKIHDSNLPEKNLRTSSQDHVYFLDLDPQAMLHLAGYLREASDLGTDISSLSAPHSPEEQCWGQNNSVSGQCSHTPISLIIRLLATRKEENCKKLSRTLQCPRMASHCFGTILLWAASTKLQLREMLHICKSLAGCITLANRAKCYHASFLSVLTHHKPPISEFNTPSL